MLGNPYTPAFQAYSGDYCARAQSQSSVVLKPRKLDTQPGGCGMTLKGPDAFMEIYSTSYESALLVHNKDIGAR